MQGATMVRHALTRPESRAHLPASMAAHCTHTHTHVGTPVLFLRYIHLEKQSLLAPPIKSHDADLDVHIPVVCRLRARAQPVKLYFATVTSSQKIRKEQVGYRAMPIHVQSPP